MLNFPPTTRVFLVIPPTDMHGSFDALAGRVRSMGLNPLDGHLYVFLNRRRQLIKLLYFDRSGWWILQKRLERGTFQLPCVPDHVDRMCVEGRVWMSMLEGIDLRAPQRRWYRRGSSPGN